MCLPKDNMFTDLLKNKLSKKIALKWNREANGAVICTYMGVMVFLAVGYGFWQQMHTESPHGARLSPQ